MRTIFSPSPLHLLARELALTCPWRHRNVLPLYSGGQVQDLALQALNQLHVHAQARSALHVRVAGARCSSSSGGGAVAVLSARVASVRGRALSLIMRARRAGAAGRS